MSNEVTAPVEVVSGDSKLRHQYGELKVRLSSLMDACRRIIGTLDTDTVLEEVLESARFLTGARYGVLLTYGDDGAVSDVLASGMTTQERAFLKYPPRGEGLLGCLNETREPLRLRDISADPRSTGFPKNHPPMKTFLGMQMRHGEEHVGNIFLTEKEFGQEFTQEDEETIFMLVSLAAVAITNTRTHENELRARAGLGALLDISPVAISVFDAKTGRMVTCNPEFRRIAGEHTTLEEDWEKAIPTWRFQHADGREIPLSELPLNRVMLFGETVRAEDIVVVFPDGRTMPTLISASPVYSDQGELIAGMLISQDMTAIADLERVRNQFLGMVSEDLRMPLATIKGSVAALSDIASSWGQAEPKHLVKIIDQQADLMRSQVNSLVELTYIDNGTLSISPEPANVMDLLNEAQKEFIKVHPGTEIETDVSEGLPRALADNQRIGQVLSNVLYSVARHTTDLTSIKVSACQIDIYVAISVSANSGAISAGESWQMVHGILGSQIQDIRKAAGGETLALAMCKGIVEAHGGRMRVEDEGMGDGISITFTILAADEVDVEIASKVSVPEFSAPPVTDPQVSDPRVTNGARILMAVDDPRLMATVRRTLSGAGYSPVPASDFGALDRIVYEENPDLLLLDLSSRTAAGLDITRRLSYDYGVPVIVLSGQGDGEDIERAFEMGADDYIVKPFSPTELVARIMATLRKRSAARQPLSAQQYMCGNVAIDYAGHTVTVSGSLVHLTATEYQLVVELSTKAGRIVTQDELLQRVWGPEYTGESQLLRSYVRSLRQKLGDNAKSPSYIFTEHGIGYRMQVPQ